MLSLLSVVVVTADIPISPLFLHTYGAAAVLSGGGSINICKQQQQQPKTAALFGTSVQQQRKATKSVNISELCNKCIK